MISFFIGRNTILWKKLSKCLLINRLVLISFYKNNHTPKRMLINVAIYQIRLLM